MAKRGIVFVSRTQKTEVTHEFAHSSTNKWSPASQTRALVQPSSLPLQGSRSQSPGLCSKGLARPERRGVEASSTPGTSRSRGWPSLLTKRTARHRPPHFSALSRLRVPRRRSARAPAQPDANNTRRTSKCSRLLPGKPPGFLPRPKTVANAPQYTSSPNKDAEVK